MLGLELAAGSDDPLVVLALGAHSDDIEIGCGGTLIHLAALRPTLEVVWVVFAAHGPRIDEARTSAERLLEPVGARDVRIQSYEESFLPYHGAEVKRYFELLKAEVEPDVIFTHCRHDLHQDHRLLCELTWNTFRDHLVLEYEVPKYDGDLATPNVYVPITRDVCDRKVETLLACFSTQQSKHWFTREVLMGLMSVRGAECRSETGYAEAFYGRKIALGASGRSSVDSPKM
jgi:LmbE family N-acetylglucosaminyl deacetylase